MLGIAALLRVAVAAQFDGSQTDETWFRVECSEADGGRREVEFERAHAQPRKPAGSSARSKLPRRPQPCIRTDCPLPSLTTNRPSNAINSLEVVAASCCAAWILCSTICCSNSSYFVLTWPSVVSSGLRHAPTRPYAKCEARRQRAPQSRLGKSTCLQKRVTLTIACAQHQCFSLHPLALAKSFSRLPSSAVACLCV